MKNLILSTLFSVFLMMLTACSSIDTKTADSSSSVDSKVLLANGYSQLRTRPQLTHAQNVFSTEQSAKLNAYRELAKQLYTEKLADGIVVADQVLKNETYRIYLDLFLREAQVVESTTIADQKKIILALTLPPRFYQCMSSTVAMVSQCLQEDNKIPFTRIGYQHAPVSKVNLACASPDCAAQLSVSGFSREKNAVDSVMLDYGLYDAEWTVNMTLKTMLRYLFLTEQVFN